MPPTIVLGYWITGKLSSILRSWIIHGQCCSRQWIVLKMFTVMPWLPPPPYRSQLMQLVRYISTVLLALNKGMLNLSIETKWSRPWSTSLFSTNWHFNCLSYRSMRSNVNKIVFHFLLPLLCTHISECTTFHVKMKSK